MDSISPAIIQRLIELGGRGDLESPGVLDLYSDLRPHDVIDRLHWRTWDKAVEGLTVEQIAALLKALTVIEAQWGWSGGSVSAVIWVFRTLSERDYQLGEQLARWIVRRSRNPWVPYGTQRSRDALLEHIGVEELAARNLDLAQSVRRYIGDHEFETRFEQWLLSELAHARERRAQEAREREERARANHARDVARRERKKRRQVRYAAYGRWRASRSFKCLQLVEEWNGLDSEERLRKIALQSDIPVDAFPPEWADVDEETLGRLPLDVLRTLLGRISPKPAPLWETFGARIRLRASPEDGEDAGP